MPNADNNPASVSRAARIGPLANLPVFFKLDGKRVVLAGGGAPALWKAELLSAAGALVEVFAPTFDEDFFALAAKPPKGQVLLVDRAWVPDDLANAALAVGSFDDHDEAAAFASAARGAGIPVNVVDQPALCDFQFGAIVNRSPLVVGISTDGAAPVFGQAIRSLIEGLLPESFALWAAAARDLRREKAGLGDTAADKRRFWQRFTDFALQRSGRGPSPAEIDQLVAGGPRTLAREPVFFVNVGAALDTLTLGAVRALRAADDIFFDEDVPAGAMDFSRREARRHPIARGRPLASVVEDLAKAARAGHRVVRLRRLPDTSTGGDDGERDALRAADVSAIKLSPGAAS